MSSGKKLNEDATFALSLSKGRQLVQLEDMCPAIFNRFGDELSGMHCLNLLYQIIKLKGFAIHKYEAGYCVTPNPDNPLENWRHASAMARNDALLPKWPEKPLKGTFKCSHLVASMLMQKQGGRYFPHSKELITDKMGNQDHREALSNGVFMHVFDFRDVEQHKDAFLALMASDNMDADVAMPEDELGIVMRIAVANATVRAGPGIPQGEAVYAHVRKFTAPSVSDQDLKHLGDYARTTPQENIKFVRAFQRFICNPQKFCVAPEFMSSVSEVSADLQNLRTALAVWMYASDKHKEVDKIQGKLQGNAVKDADLRAIRKLARPVARAIDKHMSNIYKVYWKDFVEQETHTADLLKEIGWMYRNIAKLCAKPKEVDLSSQTAVVLQLAEWEHESRERLEGTTVLPAAIWPKPVAKEGDGRPAKKLKAESPEVTKWQLDFKDGLVVQNAVFHASVKNIYHGSSVVTTVDHGFCEKGSVGVAVGISKQGVSVEFKGMTDPVVMKVSEVALHIPEAKKKEPQEPKDGNVEPACILPEGLPYKLASRAQSQQMAMAMVTTGLYKFAVSCGSGPATLRIVADPPAAFASKSLEANGLFIIPFSTDIRTVKPTDKASVELVAKWDHAGRKETRSFYSVAWETHGADATHDPPISAALPIYWWMRRVEPSADKVDLAPRTQEFMCSVGVDAMCAGKDAKHFKTKANKLQYTLSIPYWTNACKLNAGDAVCLPEGSGADIE